MKRQHFTLSEAETAQWKKLCGRRHDPDRKAVPELWKFWAQVAASRGLEYRTLLTDGESCGRMILSGFPQGYDGPWCAPWPLKCKSRP